MQRSVEERLARLRAHIHTAMLDKGLSVGQLAQQLGIVPGETLANYLAGRDPMPVWVVLRLAEMAEKPLWWFFDEPPTGITMESAQIALQNISKVRLYLEALETEFQLVTAKHRKEPTFTSYEPEAEVHPRQGGQVVDLAPYLRRARAILQREFESEEESAVSEESVEMVAQGLLSAEIGCPVTDISMRRRLQRSIEESVEG